jgi:hypothetical protein
MFSTNMSIIICMFVTNLTIIENYYREIFLNKITQ